jgi:hypothetical protein
MIKKFLTILLCAVATQSAFALDNPITDSYGKWVGSERLVVVTKNGLEEFYQENLTRKCFGKSFHKQKLFTITGKELLHEINLSIDYNTEDENVYTQYTGRLQLIKTFINKNQKYKAIKVWSDCGDGWEEFIMLSPETGIYVISGGDEGYDFIRKLD